MTTQSRPLQQDAAPHRKSICFVSETGRVDNPIDDPSVRYRCYHPSETLAALGHVCTVTSAKQFFENPLLDQDVYIFHRPNAVRPGFHTVIQVLRESGATLIADYDDLIFGTPEIALMSSAAKNGTLTEERAIKAFASNLEGLRHFDKVTTSTEPLAGYARAFNPGARVEVVPNLIPLSIHSIHEALATPAIRRRSTAIGYFAGTRSHDKDFPIVEAVLHRVLLENPALTLLVVGPVAVPRGIVALPNVYTAPVVNYLRLPALMSMCATVIAPLEQSTFNDCKSRVKFLEAALSGCRLVASPIPDMQTVGADHVTLAATTDDWYEALSEVPDVAARQAMAQRNFAFLAQNNKIDGLQALAGMK